ncbi:DUF1365 family protein [Vibrio sp.]|uniref:DUF1365 domain-containing protein n=1 Tax=Vibrio viridaestus TaxID=2487322 RepID=A0A3N9U235_9VIBR|nr:DUF1365 family protein [Vibrio viridaestus]MDC0609507.1 DUF1365 family protein [Vibrio sp.]RQW61986.1 DUF1365 domain-containing protein [Vibrio viridaestus]
MDFSSRLMIGEIRHRRFCPKNHELSYSIFMPCINLDDVDALSKRVFLFGQRAWNWARFKKSDYFHCHASTLKGAVINKVNELSGQSLSQESTTVMALINLRYAGFYFSPVNFYYVYDENDQWNSLVAEVSNTPWNERHYYILDPNDDVISFSKNFHVSPFNPIDQLYKWRVKPLSKKLMIHIECHSEEKQFDATLSLKAKPFDNKELFKLLLKTPVQSMKMLIGIYWHAFLLWKKGTPIYDHPDSKKSSSHRS